MVDHFLVRVFGQRTVLVLSARSINQTLFDLSAVLQKTTTDVTAIGHSFDGEVSWITGIDIESHDWRFIERAVFIKDRKLIVVGA